VPVRSILASAAVTLVAVLLNYLMPQNALELLMSLVVATLVINWAMISFSHFKFRQHMNKTGQKPLFKALWYPYSNYICLAFVVFILGVMLLIPGIQISVYAIPVWVVFMWVCYVIKNKRGAAGVTRPVLPSKRCRQKRQTQPMRRVFYCLRRLLQVDGVSTATNTDAFPCW
jgi:aromatic amino acid transport protein AroP